MKDIFYSFLLSQIGGFAFVLFASTETLGIFTRDQKVILTATVALSMVTTPLLILLYDLVLDRQLASQKKHWMNKLKTKT